MARDPIPLAAQPHFFAQPNVAAQPLVDQPLLAPQPVGLVEAVRRFEALPIWLTQAAVWADHPPAVSARVPQALECGPWQLRLSPQRVTPGTTIQKRPGKRRRADESPLPGRFYFGNLPPAVLPVPANANPFLLWLPLETDTSDLHLLASSRLPSPLRAHPLLLEAIRSAAESLRRSSAALLYSPQFTLASHLRAISQQFGLPLVQLTIIPPEANAAWFRNRFRAVQRKRCSAIFFSCLPPRDLIDPASLAALPVDSLARSLFPESLADEKLAASPTDWLAVHLARQVHLLSIRPGGNLDAAIRHRLQLPDQNPLDVRLLAADPLTPPWLSEQLVQAGATRWRIAAGSGQRAIPGSRHHASHLRSDSQAAICDREPSGEFLYHWTRAVELNRRRAADWSLGSRMQKMRDRFSIGREFPAEFLIGDELTRLLSSLLQILADRRLRASGRWTRNRRPVVSLTAQPLEGWRALRAFRPHLGRWDFEPCGLALSRELIQDLGGRPVIYGDEATYRRLPSAEQTFFQLSRSRGPRRAVDWTLEREWRVPDDIDLRRFGVHDAFVFVPGPEAAEIAAELSRWPVYALPPDCWGNGTREPRFAIRECRGLEYGR